METKTRILIADDHQLVIQGILCSLKDVGDFDVVTTNTCDEAFQLIKANQQTNPFQLLLNPLIGAIAAGNTHQNAKFHSNSMRVANRIELNALITEKTRQWDRDALLNELTNASVPAAPINSVQQAFEDPQVLARNMLIGLERSLGHEKIKGVRTPIKFSHSSLNLTSPSPVLGSGEMKWL